MYTEVGDVDSERGCVFVDMCERTCGICEFSVVYTQFFYKPQTVLKIVYLLKNKLSNKKIEQLN